MSLIALKRTGLLVLSCCWLIACGVNKQTADKPANGTPPTKLSVVEKMKEPDSLPVEERIALYYRLKEESPAKYDFRNENELTMYGYSLLWENKPADAVAIFRLIVAEFPDSPNAWDSLGDAYLANGEKEQALANYEKSLAMDPENFHSEDQIQLIRFPEQIPPTPEEKFAKVYTPDQYKADLDQLGEILLKVHPNALKFISREAFLQGIEAKKALITDQTTYGEFAWHCSEIVASVHCSHTSGGFYYENEMLPAAFRFPVQTQLIDGRLYVADPLSNAGNVKIKDEITHINGVTIPELVAAIYPHISTQGFIQTTKRHQFNWWATGMIAYALNFPETYTIAIQGTESPVVLKQVETFRVPYDDPLRKCGELCFEVLEDNTAVLTIGSFNYYPWSNLAVFEEFMDKTFEEIARKGVKDLVIDVRFNFGGSSESAIYLLRYLAKKRFTYFSKVEFEGKTEKLYGEEAVEPFDKRFKGRLWFLIDGVGNSTTGHFMSLVKTLELGTIVGEELGSNQFCSGGQKISRLTNTKMLVFVAINTHETSATSLPDEVGILPDHTVKQSVEDYFEARDTVKEYTLQLIRTR